MFPCRVLLGCGFLIISLQATFSQDVPKGMLEQSLAIPPTQKGIEIDIPNAEEVARCKIEHYDGRKGYIVKNPQGQTIRLFLDRKGSGRINQWSFFKNGVEVYRDIDTDSNGAADEFRWLNNGGTRWGVDTDGDYEINYWKSISPEEVSKEIIAALAANDTKRFLSVVLSPEELKALSFGSEHHETVSKKIAGLKSGFTEAIKTIAIDPAMQWYQLNAGQPGLVPSGEKGNGKDLIVYENACTTLGNGNETKQIFIGTLVQIGENNWRVIDLPKIYDENSLASTFIPLTPVIQSGGGSDSEVVALINQYQSLVAALPNAPTAERSKRYKDIVFLMLKIVSKTPTQEDRELWVRLLVDTIMEGVQENAFPEGPQQISSIYETFKQLGDDELAAYIRYRQIMVDFYTDMHAGKNDVKTYTTWLENLEKLVDLYEKTETGIEATQQIAINKEMTARSPEEPLKWYTKIAATAAGKPIGEKAKGAIRRLNATGQAVPFTGTDTANKPFNIVSLKGTPVLLCFWDSRNADDLVGIKEAADQAKVRVVGVNLDEDPKAMASISAKLGWTQLYAPGGLDSPPAVYWGIQSTPYMILYDASGKVANPNVLGADDLTQIMQEQE